MTLQLRVGEIERILDKKILFLIITIITVNVCQCNKCVAESDVYRRRSLLGRPVPGPGNFCIQWAAYTVGPGNSTLNLARPTFGAFRRLWSDVNLAIFTTPLIRV